MENREHGMDQLITFLAVLYRIKEVENSHVTAILERCCVLSGLFAKCLQMWIWMCIACNKACHGCTGPSAGNCVACAEKHYLDSDSDNICKRLCIDLHFVFRIAHSQAHFLNEAGSNFCCWFIFSEVSDIVISTV